MPGVAGPPTGDRRSARSWPNTTGAPPLSPGAQDEVDDVPQEVVSGDVGRPHGGVGGATPVFSTAQLQLPVLVDLARWRRRGRKAVTGRRLAKDSHARDRGGRRWATDQWPGAAQGPVTLPSRVSATSSSRSALVCSWSLAGRLSSPHRAGSPA